MPLKIASCETSPISLPAYLGWLDAHVSFSDPHSLVESAPMLQRLAANRRFLGDWLIEHYLSAPDEFQSGNQYNFQSFVLAVTDDYLLRANFWKPASQIHDRSGMENDAFGYGIAHNHNFHLLTVGYSGAGYDTHMYRLRNPEHVPVPGAAVELDALGTWHLGAGEVMFYEAFTDVHTQVAPADLSVSLNLMTHSSRAALPQYTFEPEHGRVVDFVPSPLDARVRWLDAVRLLLPAQAEAELARMAAADESPRLRQLAAQALQA